MNLLAETLNFFGNPNLDRHRLLQGKWEPMRINHYDSDDVSDDPLEHLLGILAESLASHASSESRALQALRSLVATAEQNLSQEAFSNVIRPFWRGFQFVAEKAAVELGIDFKSISREDVHALILAGI